MSGISQPRHATLVAVTAMPGQEADAPGGTLAVSGWRGAQVALVTLSGASDPRLRDSAARAAALLGVGTHFHWNASEERGLRLARVFRALQPHVVLAHPAVQATVHEAWSLATDESFRLPGLSTLDDSASRLWVAESDGETAVDVSAARPLQRAIAHYYPPSHALPMPRSPLEHFALLAGPPLAPDALPDDLFAGLNHAPLRPPVSFLHIECRG